jgi:type 1 glutamine amidotransferase
MLQKMNASPTPFGFSPRQHSMQHTKGIKLVLPLLTALALLVSGVHADAAKIKVLIIDGQNNHKWAETTPYLKAILVEAGVFTADVSTTPPSKPIAHQLPKDATPQQKAAHEKALKAFEGSDALWAKWRPRFSDYNVIVSNYNGEEWPEEVRAAFVAFVKNGGGFVSYHAADNAFANWADYNDMIALGGWGGRNEKSGPYLRLREGVWAKVQAPGPCGGHGAQHEFLIETFAPEHPIMKGLPSKWMHTKDELYHQLRGPAKEVNVLGSSLSDVTHEREPMLMAISFGKGRVFHTTLGHYVEALQGLGFQVTFARGTEWAATGRVTQPAPKPGELTEGPTAAMHELKIKAPTP